jgi:hypothetical protein
MIRLPIQNIIERSKRLQLLFEMLIYKAMKRPENGGTKDALEPQDTWQTK